MVDITPRNLLDNFTRVTNETLFANQARSLERLTENDKENKKSSKVSTQKTNNNNNNNNSWQKAFKKLQTIR